MKIEIDTKEDSHETIRKAIDLLKSIVGESAYSNKPRDIFSDDSYGSSSKSESSSGVFGSIFDSPSNSESAPSSTELLEEEKEEKEERIEIIPY